MVQRWVISAYKPRVRCRQSKPRKLNTAIDVKGTAKNRKLYSEEELEVAQSSMKDLFQKFDQTILFDSEVTIYLYILYIHMYVYLCNFIMITLSVTIKVCFLFIVSANNTNLPVKLVNDVKSYAYAQPQTSSQLTEISLENRMSQQVLHLSMSFDEFIQLKTEIRVRH